MASTKTNALKVNSDGAAKCGHCGELDIWQQGVTVDANKSVNIKFFCNPCKQYSFLFIEQYKDVTYFIWMPEK